MERSARAVCLGPHRTCRDRLFTARLRAGSPLVLPGETEAEWRQYGDAWVDTRDLAWIAAECLVRPLGDAANVLNSHFVWHDVYDTLIRVSGSGSRIEHKALADITEDELPHKALYAQRWRFSNARLVQQLTFQPWHALHATLAEVGNLLPENTNQDTTGCG